MSPSRKVLYLGPLDLTNLVEEQLGPEYAVVSANDESAARLHLRDATHILDAYMRVRFSSEMLAMAPGLRAVVTATTGADHIDAEALRVRDIPLLTLRGQTDLLRSLTPAAELSWLLVMACARRIRGAIDDVLAGSWDRNRHPGLMLKGRSIGIVGCGRIGQWMARYAEAFGMHRLGYDPHIDPWPPGIECVPLGELLARSDVISVHVPLNDQTRGLLGAREFESLRHGAILVNTSRGEVVEEAAMLRALETGRLGAVGLDVLTGEPNVTSSAVVEYARTHSNVIITPHIGGFSPDAVRTVLKFCCERIRALDAS